jgi:hypothetical protein
MICPTCRGRQFVPDGPGDDDEAVKMKPCPDCIGGIASCCDAAGAYVEPVFVCAACGAVQRERTIRCEQCGEPLVFPKFGDDPYDTNRCGYRDDTCPERLCDRCGTLYRGPAVYCSLQCAIDDAA